MSTMRLPRQRKDVKETHIRVTKKNVYTLKYGISTYLPIPVLCMRAVVILNTNTRFANLPSANANVCNCLVY